MSKRHAEQLLHKQVQKIQEAGCSVKEAHLELGMPDTKIINLAETIGADLIAMGARGLGAVKRSLIGSVADSVVRHAHTSVMVIRELP
jgi:nucleotide-binding universal stress UspA family protein